MDLLLLSHSYNAQNTLTQETLFEQVNFCSTQINTTFFYRILHSTDTFIFHLFNNTADCTQTFTMLVKSLEKPVKYS